MVFFGQVTRHQIRVEHSRLLVRLACPSAAGWAQKRCFAASRWALKSWLRTSQHLSVTKNRQQINRSTLIRLADKMPLLCIRSMACTPWTAEIGSRMPEVAQYGKVAPKKNCSSCHLKHFRIELGNSRRFSEVFCSSHPISSAPGTR